MITKETINKLLLALHFEQDGDVFTKSYKGVSSSLKVDVKNEHFHYKEVGIAVGRETTSNFSEPENFVVFECVNRLLSMGYKPEHIELEPSWKLGHTRKGGYADIWVRTHSCLSGEMAADKESLLIIECKSFSKELKTSKINHKPKDKFDYTRLENILAKIEGVNLKVQENEILQNGNIPVITQEKDNLISGYVNSANCIKIHPVIVFGDHSCTFKYVDFDFVRGADGTQLIQSRNKKIHLKYLYHFLANSKIQNAERYERHFKYLKDMWIPLADEKSQKYIIQECEAVDKEVEEARTEIATAKEQIEQVFSNATKNGTRTLRLGDSRIFNLSIGRRVVSNEIVQDGKYRVVSANVHDEFGRINYSVLDDFSAPSVLWGIDGDWMVSYIEKNILFAPTDHCGVIRILNETEILPKYLTYSLLKAGEQERFSRANRASTERVRALTITVPDIDTQKDVVARVREYETMIAEAKAIINDSAERKQAILDKYLK